MITLKKIDNTDITVNADEIEFIESAHYSTITLRSGKKIVVQDDVESIIEKTIIYKRKCHEPYNVSYKGKSTDI